MNGADAGSVEVEDGGYPVYGSGGEFRRAREYLYDGESVLFGRKGTVDKPLYVNERFWTVDTMFYTVIDERFLLARFAYYWALTLPYGAWSTDTALPSMTSAAIKAAAISLPPVSEQRAIADYLDRETARIDALIAKNEELIALLGERRKALIYHSIVNHVHASAPESSGQADLHHGTGSPMRSGLARAAKTVGGSGFPEVEQGQEGLEIAFYKVNALAQADRDGVIRQIWDTITAETARALHATVLPVGSVVMAKIGAALLLGRTRRTSVRACIDNNMMALVPSQSLNSRYMAYLVQTMDMNLFANPGAVPSLNIYEFMHYKVPIPSLHEQVAIAEQLDAELGQLDNAIGVAHEAVDFARERRTALISAAVTGKIDVGAAA
jgi:type I restriction enzyme S subunit